MATVVPSIGLKGIEGYVVKVEVQVMPGLEGVSIVGLPDASVKESKERVLAALHCYKCEEILTRKIIINLSPAEQKKNSPVFDLAMAIGIMKETGFMREVIPSDTAFLGILSLDGSVKPVDGMLPAILAAKREGFKILYLPPLQDIPLTHIEGIELRFVQSLQEVLDSLNGQLSVFSLPPQEPIPFQKNASEKDFKHVIGHEQAKRALEIAAAGGHHLLMSGPPGCGKSLLAETFPSIVPLMSQEGQFEVMSIYQLAGTTNPSFQTPPFRSPHHSASSVSLIGGGSNPKPGEVSLAHRGVLFLDEMAEFPKRTLDMLRQPLETGKVTISRAASTVTYPSRFILIGAMNPCPCGYLGASHRYCTCSPKQVKKYQNRISGPILDRMDIHLILSAVPLDGDSIEHNEPSAAIREKVTAARQRQYERYQAEIYNAVVPPEILLQQVGLNAGQEKMIQQMSSKQNWSTRVQMKIIRLARTISDLNGDELITDEAIWEAMTLKRENNNRNQKVVVR
ncbi:YifB family Mg chelatase-like AAA ATPase [Pseudalkalibacillus caeni]|uniref:ATP-binding protein n=1 Tax=Exobacillus caeni TaxID=2574798 RepID=A0A5R9F8G5_9BACL|nr:YifB family Mg chelatase-like AAA ATPase [Pseudalkalibacillus caeni]TLS38606.1 ATP-binding protein [Pseudalkalibacillus caeni]